MPKFRLKPFIFIFVIIAIFVSFLFLKIQKNYIARNFVDTSISEPSIEEITLNPKYSSKLKKFSNISELNSFIEKNTNNNSYNYSNLKRSSNLQVMSPDQDFTVAETKGDYSLADNPSIDFSETNIQVQGVDEADIVKTDGQYIYYTSGQNLYIAKSYPVEETKIVSKIEFDFNLSDIYINKNSLVVFGNTSGIYDGNLSRSKAMVMPRPSELVLQVFNIENKEKPNKERDIKMDGYYFNSRLIGDYLYFVVNNYNYDGGLPRIYSQEKLLNFDCQEGLKCSKSSIYYFDDHYSDFNLSTILSFNVNDYNSDLENSFYLLPSGQNLYVSKNNIYITYTKYLDEYEVETEALLQIVYPRLSEKDRNFIDEIRVVSDSILNLSEKRFKIRRVLDAYIDFIALSEKESLQKELENKVLEKYPDLINELEKTVIHKLAVFKGSVEPMFVASIPGTVLNQFSMDEFGGFFRVATTKNRTWPRLGILESESNNNLYIMDSELDLAGEIRGLAEGERIYSVRFMGERAYIVTFKQVDPLFSLDLKDPYNPKVLGELKIPGFSSYLHPYSKDILIGFGKQTEELSESNVEILGLKLSLFDVSSSSPTELDSYIIGDAGSYSIALDDHRAFLFSKEKNILAIPAVLRDKSLENSWGKTSFNGLLIFSIVDNKFVLKGKIDHLNSDSTDYYKNSVRRSLYIDSFLYSFSNDLIKINKLEDLEELKRINLN